MKKFFTLTLMACALVAQARVYTLADLASIVGTLNNQYEKNGETVSETVGVSVVDGAYVLTLPTGFAGDVTGIGYDDNNIVMGKSYLTIKEGNGLKVSAGEVLRFAGSAAIEIEGSLDAEGATFGAVEGSEGIAYGFRLYKEGAGVSLQSCTFEHVGINYGNGSEEGNFTAIDCRFADHNGKSGSANINFTSLSKDNLIQNCVFDSPQLAAVGSGANVACGITIKNCVVNKPVASTRLYPGINMSATGPYDIIIEGNEVHGPAENTRSGGIALSCLLGNPPTGNLYVRSNFVEDCSYGITLTGPGNVFIEDNVVLNNKYIANVNAGGSGLNITCNSASVVAKAYIRGNTIEGNVWGVTAIGSVDINAGKVEDSTAEDYNPGQNVFKNNGNGDPFVQYDWYNNTTATSYAQGNIWSVDVQDAEHIEQVIVHKADNEALGEVIYMPAGTQSGITEVNAGRQDAGVRYNLMGQPVGDNYRGIVIENGSKRIVK